MVLGSRARGVQYVLFTPFARAFLKLGLTPNAVTVIGTLLTTAAALTLIPMGYLVTGSLALGVLVLTDSIDGIMARESGTSGAYGAFLDSTLDRVSDAAIFAGVLMWFFFHTSDAARLAGIIAALACLAFGAMVPYVRAKAESLGVDASVGVAERADRIVVVLVATFITGLGVPVGVMIGVLALLAAASVITVAQRIRATARGLGERRG